MKRPRHTEHQRRRPGAHAHPRQDESTLHEIRLETNSDKTLAEILYRQDRGNLHQYFGQKFGVFFDTEPGSHKLTFSGTPEAASRVKRAFAMLSGMVQGSDTRIDKGVISSIATQVNPHHGLTGAFKTAANQNNNSHEDGSKGGTFQALNPAQENLAKLIDENDLIFALGPAGTGKTHVAVVKAIASLKEGKVSKILLARPAAEAGEKIGYLPGDANAKLAPYMRPIYDELDKAFGVGKYKTMMEQGVVEIVPVGYMRGRTFDNAFIILDEAQNLTIEQAKMAITRTGKGSKMVMTGDPMQIDLQKKEDSGLMWAAEIMEGAPRSAKQVFEQTDIVRSEIVQTFIQAIEKWESKNGKPAPQGPGAKGGPSN